MEHARRARPTMVRRGHPCAWGDRRAPHGHPHGPRARAPRSARRPLLVQRRASAPRPPAPRLRRTRRTRVLLPGPLSQGWWGCQGTRAPPRPPHNRGARPYTPIHAPYFNRTGLYRDTPLHHWSGRVNYWRPAFPLGPPRSPRHTVVGRPSGSIEPRGHGCGSAVPVMSGVPADNSRVLSPSPHDAL